MKSPLVLNSVFFSVIIFSVVVFIILLFKKDVSILPPNNYWIVDPSRTDIYSADGSILKPFKTITSCVNHIEDLIDNGDLTLLINGSIVENPQFISLLSSTTENVALTRGNIFIGAATPNAGHVPIWINGYVTVTPSDSSANAINLNRFGLFNIAINNTSTNDCIKCTGANPAKLYLQNVYAYQNNNSKSCVYTDNSGTGTRLELTDCTMARSSGSVYLIDIQKGYCSIKNLETNGVGQVLNFANNSTGTLLSSSLECNIGSVITLSGTVQFGMGECIINNTSTGVAIGIDMSGTATIQFGVCTFNVPTSSGNFAIKGVGTNTVLYSGPIFQYGSTTKISSAIILSPLSTSFTT
jgi:hypothetical protein